MPKVTILTARVGEGHLSHAKALASLFAQNGYETDICDILNLAPKKAKFLNNIYQNQITNLPIIYRFLYWWTSYFKLPLRLYILIVRLAFQKSLRNYLSIHPSDLLIGNHPYPAQIVPRLRHKKLVRTPYVTFLTDLNTHPLWLSRYNKNYICSSSITKKKILRQLPRAEVITSAPIIRPDFFQFTPSPRPPTDQQSYKILLTGGSWGAGSILKVAKRLSLKENIQTIVLCGHNTKLAKKIASLPNSQAVLWTDDIFSYFQSANLVIQNAGGASAYEALAVGTPVITYKPIPGHGKENAKILNQLGWIPYVKRFSRILEAPKTPAPPSILNLFSQESASLPRALEATNLNAPPTRTFSPRGYLYRLRGILIGLASYFLLFFSMPDNHRSPALLEHAVRFIVHFGSHLDKYKFFEFTPFQKLPPFR